jgi:quercetin dioxygenase-like cupin family protein
MKAGYTEMAKTMGKTKKRSGKITKGKTPKAKTANRKSTRRAVSKKTQQSKMALKYVPWSTVDLEDLNPLLQRQFVVGRDIMVARVLMKKGCIIPLHSHFNEQFTYILEGALKFWIDGKEIVVKAGEVLTIPPHMPHKAEALVDTVDLDVFNPPRADWINKTDEYLRGGK